MNWSIPKNRILSIKYWIIILELNVVIFGGVILKLLHVPNGLGLNVLSFFDYLPLIAWLILNPRFNSKSDNILKNFKLWIIIGIIFITTCTMDVIHHSSLISTIGHIGVLIRYIPLSLLIIDIGCDQRLLNNLINSINRITTILLILSYLSIILGQKASLMLPIMSASNTAERGLLGGEISGIFAHTIDLSFCLLILYIFVIFQSKFGIKKLLFYTILYGIPIYYTGSVASLAMLCLLFIYYLKQINLKYFYFIIVTSITVGIFIISKYWIEIKVIYEVAKLSRLGILTIILPNFITELSIDTFLGIGTNIDVIFEKVNSYPEKVHILEYMYDLGGFADVYWFALIIYHGIIGFALLFYAFYKLFNSLLRSTNIKKLKVFINSLWITILLLGFFNQVLAVKPFAIFLWIFIGIIYSSLHNNYIYGFKLERLSQSKRW